MKKGSHDQSGSLRGGMIFVLVKAIVFTIAFLFVSVFVFGMLRCPDDSMTDLTESIEHQTSLS